MADHNPYGHAFNDSAPGQPGGDQNLLHAIRGNIMGGNEYRVQNLPRASVYLAAAGSVASSAVTGVAWDTTEYDSASMFSTGAPGRLTARTAGLYHVKGWWTWDQNVTSLRSIFIRRTIASTLVQASFPPGVIGEGKTVFAINAGFYTYTDCEFDMQLNVSDYVELFVTQFSGAGLAYIPSTTTARYNGLQATMHSTLG